MSYNGILLEKCLQSPQLTTHLGLCDRDYVFSIAVNVENSNIKENRMNE